MPFLYDISFRFSFLLNIIFQRLKTRMAQKIKAIYIKVKFITRTILCTKKMFSKIVKIISKHLFFHFFCLEINFWRVSGWFDSLCIAFLRNKSKISLAILTVVHRRETDCYMCKEKYPVWLAGGGVKKPFFSCTDLTNLFAEIVYNSS